LAVGVVTGEDLAFEGQFLLDHIVGYYMCSRYKGQGRYAIFHILTGKRAKGAPFSYSTFQECIQDLYSIYGQRLD
jgi:hypothetical protein